jgi:DNA-binding NarL/FixJ family response regulator
VKLVLVDDHALFREALGALLEANNPTVDIVGEAATAQAAIEVVLTRSPDLILMDTMLAGESGIAATQEMRRLKIKTPVVFLSAVRDLAFVVDAMAAGAQGYALKENTLEETRRAIDTVLAGSTYLAPGLEAAREDDPASPADESVFDKLSAREREVFRLVVAGYTNVRIGSALFISVKTVETHRSRINQKLFVHSTSQLIRLAALRGMLTS